MKDNQGIQKYQGLFFTVIYSAYDGGWYCEIFNKDGETIFTTKTANTENLAIKNAVKKIKSFKKKN